MNFSYRRHQRRCYCQIFFLPHPHIQLCPSLSLFTLSSITAVYLNLSISACLPTLQNLSYQSILIIYLSVEIAYPSHVSADPALWIFLMLQVVLQQQPKEAECWT